MSEVMTQDTRRITLSQLIRDPKFQVRRKLDQPTISKYIEVLKAGNNMPPIQVVYINDAPLLIDGWHRVQAMETIGRLEADAFVLDATEQEAHWLAAKANMGHGLPLKKSELREVFRAYVKAGQHKKNRGIYRSYREMQADLSISFSTIRTWMFRDFPHIAAKIGGNENFKGKGGLRSTHDPSSVQDAAMQGLNEAHRLFQSTADPEARGEIISRMGELLADMKQAGNWKLRPPPDF